jgi:hypothetical protein
MVSFDAVVATLQDCMRTQAGKKPVSLPGTKTRQPRRCFTIFQIKGSGKRLNVKKGASGKGASLIAALLLWKASSMSALYADTEGIRPKDLDNSKKRLTGVISPDW